MSLFPCQHNAFILGPFGRAERAITTALSSNTLQSF
jgi:hypothetical protein